MFPAIYLTTLALATALTIRRSHLSIQRVPLKAAITCFAVLLLGSLMEDERGVAASVVSAAIFTAVAWLVALVANSLGQFSFGSPASSDHRRLFFRTAAALVVMVATTIVVAAAVGNRGSLTLGNRMQQSVILGVVVLPIFEEVLFRAIPLGLINHWKLPGAWSSWVYYIGTSGCFSLCHIFPLHPFRTPQTIAIGLTLGLLYKKDGLLASTFAHILFNAAVLIYLISK